MTDTAETAALPLRRPHDNQYLAGNYAAVESEVTAHDLPVVGEIPVELEGRWLRNGPNPESVDDPALHHWFLGTGMVHGVRLRGGKAEWYKNRFVLNAADRALASSARTRTSAVSPARPGRWSKLANHPSSLTTNSTRSASTDSMTRSTVRSPPTRSTTSRPASSIRVNYHWPDLIDHVNYTVVGGDGRVTKNVAIPVADMPMMHDMSLTEKYVVVYDLPVTVNMDVLVAGYAFPFKWNNDRAARVGLLPRNGAADDIIWCDVDPCYVFHPSTPTTRPTERLLLIFAGTTTSWSMIGRVPLPRRPRHSTGGSSTRRRVGSLRLGSVTARKNSRGTIRDSDSRNTVTGTPPRSSRDQVANLHGSTLKTDFSTGAVDEHDYGHGRGGAEPVFVPKIDGTNEDDGWLLTVVYDATTDGSELCVLDAADLGRGEVARISLPQRVPFGFHGNWVPDSSVAPS